MNIISVTEQQQKVLADIQQIFDRYFESVSEAQASISKQEEDARIYFEKVQEEANNLFIEAGKIAEATHFVFELGDYEQSIKDNEDLIPLTSDGSNSDKQRFLKDAESYIAEARNLFNKLKTEMSNTDSPLEISFLKKDNQNTISVNNYVKKRAGFESGSNWGCLGMIGAVFVFFLTSGANFIVDFVNYVCISAIIGGGFGFYMITNINNNRLKLFYDITRHTDAVKRNIKAFIELVDTEYQEQLNRLAVRYAESLQSEQTQVDVKLLEIELDLTNICTQIDAVSPAWDDQLWLEKYPDPPKKE